MILLTPVAVAKVKSVLEAQGTDKGLRISVVGTGCSGFQYKMTLDTTAGADDETIVVEGLKVFVDRHSLLYLKGTRIDFVDEKYGSGFKFENPNVPASCGCGETFEV